VRESFSVAVLQRPDANSLQQRKLRTAHASHYQETTLIEASLNRNPALRSFLNMLWERYPDFSAEPPAT
jgi:hypothetical protein